MAYLATATHVILHPRPSEGGITLLSAIMQPQLDSGWAVLGSRLHPNFGDYPVVVVARTFAVGFSPLAGAAEEWVCDIDVWASDDDADDPGDDASDVAHDLCLDIQTALFDISERQEMFTTRGVRWYVRAVERIGWGVLVEPPTEVHSYGMNLQMQLGIATQG